MLPEYIIEAQLIATGVAAELRPPGVVEAFDAGVVPTENDPALVETASRGVSFQLVFSHLSGNDTRVVETTGRADCRFVVDALANGVTKDRNVGLTEVILDEIANCHEEPNRSVDPERIVVIWKVLMGKELVSTRISAGIREEITGRTHVPAWFCTDLITEDHEFRARAVTRLLERVLCRGDRGVDGDLHDRLKAPSCEGTLQSAVELASEARDGATVRCRVDQSPTAPATC